MLLIQKNFCTLDSCPGRQIYISLFTALKYECYIPSEKVTLIFGEEFREDLKIRLQIQKSQMRTASHVYQSVSK